MTFRRLCALRRTFLFEPSADGFDVDVKVSGAFRYPCRWLDLGPGRLEDRLPARARQRGESRAEVFVVRPRRPAAASLAAPPFGVRGRQRLGRLPAAAHHDLTIVHQSLGEQGTLCALFAVGREGQRETPA